jgi:hypothetical protein
MYYRFTKINTNFLKINLYNINKKVAYIGRSLTVVDWA